MQTKSYTLIKGTRATCSILPSDDHNNNSSNYQSNETLPLRFTPTKKQGKIFKNYFLKLV